MKKISTNGAALLIMFLSFIGYDMSEEAAEEIISAAVLLGSFILAVYNQFSRKDVKNFFFSKDS